jgi:hypothetical protein
VTDCPPFSSALENVNSEPDPALHPALFPREAAAGAPDLVYATGPRWTYVATQRAVSDTVRSRGRTDLQVSDTLHCILLQDMLWLAIGDKQGGALYASRVYERQDGSRVAIVGFARESGGPVVWYREWPLKADQQLMRAPAGTWLEWVRQNTTRFVEGLPELQQKALRSAWWKHTHPSSSGSSATAEQPTQLTNQVAATATATATATTPDTPPTRIKRERKPTAAPSVTSAGAPKKKPKKKASKKKKKQAIDVCGDSSCTETDEESFSPTSTQRTVKPPTKKKKSPRRAAATPTATPAQLQLMEMLTQVVRELTSTTEVVSTSAQQLAQHAAVRQPAPAPAQPYQPPPPQQFVAHPPASYPVASAPLQGWSHSNTSPHARTGHVNCRCCQCLALHTQGCQCSQRY